MSSSGQSILCLYHNTESSAHARSLSNNSTPAVQIKTKKSYLISYFDTCCVGNLLCCGGFLTHGFCNTTRPDTSKNTFGVVIMSQARGAIEWWSALMASPTWDYNIKFLTCPTFVRFKAPLGISFLGKGFKDVLRHHEQSNSF